MMDKLVGAFVWHSRYFWNATSCQPGWPREREGNSRPVLQRPQPLPGQTADVGSCMGLPESGNSHSVYHCFFQEISSFPQILGKIEDLTGFQIILTMTWSKKYLDLVTYLCVDVFWVNIYVSTSIIYIYIYL